MTSASDLTLMLASDGKDWGKYISDKLDTFHKVTHASLVLDDQEYENPPELTLACRQSAVVLLLATPQLLEYMKNKAGWFSRTLQDTPTTSSIVVVLLLDRKDVDDVTKDNYVTSGWTYLEAGYDAVEVQKMIAKVLDIVDECQLAKQKADECQLAKQKAESESVDYIAMTGQGTWPQYTPPTTPGKVGVEFYPSKIYESGVPVAMVFDEEIKGDVSLKFKPTDAQQLTTTRKNATVFTFNAPQLAAGKYNVLVYVDNKRMPGCRPQLTVRGVETASFTSPSYLKQALGVNDLHELDLRLKDIFNNSLPADRALDVIFQDLPPQQSADQHKNADTQYPTLLHYAAAHGMSEFCVALLECPGSTLAFRIRNSKGLDPADLAAEGGFDELENYIIDFMEMQTANEVYGHYIAMNPPDKDEGDSDDSYEDMRHLMSPTERGRLLSEPALPFGSPPALPPRNQTLSAAGRLDRPPKPPPRTKGPSRTMSERKVVSTSDAQTAPSESHKYRTLPVGTKLDPKAFMGMDSSETAVPLDLPKGAMGSRSQSELIEMNEMVKSGEINLNEAQMLYRAWRERYGRNNAVSFKERQKDLSEIKTEYMRVRKEQNEEQGSESRSFLSRFGIGRGQGKQKTVKLDITDPVLQRQTKKPGPKVYTKSASTSQLLVSAADRDSAVSSDWRDSGISQGSRDSTMSGTYEPEVQNEADDVFGDEEVSKRGRRETSTSTTNRLSLGQFYLQQAMESANSSDKPPPVLPPRTHGPSRKVSVDSTVLRGTDL